MSEKGYQGWENYETWNVALWLNNEEGNYKYWRGMAEECKAEYPAEPNYETKEYKTARLALADNLKEQLEEGMPELEGFWGDLLSAAFSEVNWLEIADSFLEE